MKAEILKIAGVKNEAEFYRKFPTEEAFMKAHGKEFRKAKLGVSMGVSKAQNGKIKGKSMEQLASEKQKCGITERASKEDRAASRELMKLPDVVEIPEWQEISNIENLGLDKKGRKALEKEYESIKAKYPGLDLPTYVAAVRDAGRTNIQFANPERAKYFDPKTGSLLPNVDRRAIDPYLRFYRQQFPTQSKIAPTDVLDIFSRMPGGFSNYSKYADVGYVPPMQKQGGQTKKLKQLTSFEGDIDNIIPTAQGGIGLNSPAGRNVRFTPRMSASGIPQDEVLPLTAEELAQQKEEQRQETNRANWMSDPQNELGASSIGKPFYEGKGLKTPTYDPSKTYKPFSQKGDLLGKIGGLSGAMGIASDIIGNIQDLGAERQAAREAEQARKVSELTLTASGTRDQQSRRRYVRDEDVIIQPEQLFPSYGVGTNYLSAKDGAVLKAEDGMQIGGNLTEIQNTYAPNTLYDNLGYEPLGESDVVKQYYGGGYVPQAKFGINDFISGGGGNLIGQGIDAITGGSNAGGRLGSTILGTAGKLIGGPVGGLIGGAVGQFAGNLLNPYGRRIKRDTEATQKNLQTATMQSGMQALQQGQYSSYVEHGGNIPHGEYGWMSHTWQPQVITHFGEHKVSDLLKADPTMDTLRTGGNIRQNEMFPTDQFNFGGELQTTWGGYAEPISQNPYLPGTGQTVMFRGNSHEESDRKGRTGIGVKYGNDGEYSPYMEYGKDGIEDVTDVEVERGEPAQEMIDPQTGEKNMVVFGNLKINKQSAVDIGDPKAAGKKFKNYVAGLSKQEARQNKILEKAANKVDELETITPFDKLTLASLDAMQMGAHMKLQDIAKKKTKASIVQNALNETAEEYGLDADSLAKGKIKIDKEAMKQTARFGKEIFKAQPGSTIIPANQQTPPRRGQRRLVDDNSEVYDDATGEWISDAEYLKKYNLDGTPKQGVPKTSTYTGTTTTPTMTDEQVYDKVMEAYNKAKAYNDAKPGKPNPYIKEFQELYHQYFPDVAEKIITGARDVTAKARKSGIKSVDQLKKLPREKILETNEDEYFGPRTEQYIAALKQPSRKKMTLTETPLEPSLDTLKKQEIYTGPYPYSKLKPKFPFGDILGMFDVPLQDTNVDLYPEMMAISMNPLGDVPAQTFQPQLLTPYDVSYQDQLNEVTAQARDAMRMAMGDPSALAAISSQANRAKSDILGKQFRENQAQRMDVYNQNINTINQAKPQNLGILDTQTVRKKTAESKTKETALAAAQSISDKIRQNRLENRSLAVLENMYPNYRLNRNMRFTPRGLTYFDIPEIYSGTVGGTQIPSMATPPYVPVGSTSNYTGSVAPVFPQGGLSTSEEQNLFKELGQDILVQKKGGKTPKKESRNSMIVKAIKNL